MAIIPAEVLISIIDRGYVVSLRDDRLNQAYLGKYMVVEGDYTESYELPTKDASNGPWCIVGNDLVELINDAERNAP